jgi:hypothetical protein
MPVDIRGNITTNLGGSLISASLNDSYVTGAGIIKTTGHAIIQGSLSALISPGDDVTFSIDTATSGYQIPRFVKYVSARYNPVERTTRVELACNFALKESYAENIVWTPSDDPANESFTSADDGYGIITQPIHSKSIAAFCLSKLELDLPFGQTLDDLFPLLFTRPEFDFSAGYVQILNDLFLSINKVGIGGRGASISIVSLDLTPAGSVPALSSSNLIGLEPTGAAVPPSSVVVEFDAIRLKQPDTEDAEKRNWEVEEIIGAPTTVRLSYKKPDGDLWESTFKYVPYTKIWREYDEWDRVIRNTTVERTIVAAACASYLQATVEDNVTNGSTVVGATAVGLALKPMDTTRVVEIKYVKDARPMPVTEPTTPPAGYEEVLEETETVYQPRAMVLCSVAPGFFDEENNLISVSFANVNYGDQAGSFPRPTTYAGIITSITTTTYEKASRNVTVISGTKFDADDNEYNTYSRLGYFPVTKTTTKSVKAYAYTSRGQQDIASRVEQGETLEDIAADVIALADDGSDVRIVSGREAVLQARPSYVDRILADSADTSSGAESDNGYSTIQETESIITGDSDIGFTPFKVRLPFVWDDKFLRIGIAPNISYISQRPPAGNRPEDVAVEFGRIQGALNIGSQLGYSVQCAGDALGDSPVGRVIVQLGGSSAYFLLNGTTYTLSSEGVVASSDLIALGNGGGLSAWLPQPSGVSLPALPEITSTAPTTLLGTIATVGSDAQTALDAAYPDAEAGDGVRAEDTGSYWVYDGTNWEDVGLTPGDVVINPVIVPMYEEIVLLRGTVRSKVTVSRLPYALGLLTTATVTTRTKVVGTRIRKVLVPAAGVSVAQLVPKVTSGGSVKPPLAAVALAAAAPAVASGASVAVPLSTIAVAGLDPEQAGKLKTQVFVPSADLSLSAMAPALSTGASVAVPAKDLAVAALAPKAGYIDPDFSSVSLLLHMDGSNGSTTFTDSSSNALTVTAYGNAAISTAQSQFGGASGLFDGNGDYLTTTSTATPSGTQAFTIEGWFRISSLPASGVKSITHWLNTNGINLEIDSTGKIGLFIHQAALFVNSSTAITAATWNHIALTRSGNTFTVYLNGSSVSTLTSSVSFNAATLYIGRDSTATPGRDFNGYIDEYRVTKGVARYTANFTPSTVAFPSQ